MHTKLYTCTLFVLFFLSLPSVSSAVLGDSSGGSSGGSDCALSQIQNEAEKMRSEIADAVFDEYLVDPEHYAETAQDCFGGIMDANAGVSLGIPSIGDIADGACDFAQDVVGEHITDLNAHYDINLTDEFFNSSPFFENYSTGASAGTSSDEIADEVWEAINQAETANNN